MKYTVLWVDESGIRVKTKIHSSFESFDDAYNSIVKWWKFNSFYPKYVRILGDITKNNSVKIDYGSHFYFYKIVKTDKMSIELDWDNNYGAKP